MSGRRLCEIDALFIKVLVGGVDELFCLETQPIYLISQTLQVILQIIHLGVDLGLPGHEILHGFRVCLKSTTKRVESLVVLHPVLLHVLQHSREINYVLIHGRQLLLLARLVLRP